MTDPKLDASTYCGRGDCVPCRARSYTNSDDTTKPDTAPAPKVDLPECVKALRGFTPKWLRRYLLMIYNDGTTSSRVVTESLEWLATSPELAATCDRLEAAEANERNDCRVIKQRGETISKLQTALDEACAEVERLKVERNRMMPFLFFFYGYNIAHANEFRADQLPFRTDMDAWRSLPDDVKRDALDLLTPGPDHDT